MHANPCDKIQLVCKFVAPRLAATKRKQSAELP